MTATALLQRLQTFSRLVTSDISKALTMHKLLNTVKICQAVARIHPYMRYACAFKAEFPQCTKPQHATTARLEDCKLMSEAVA